MSKVTTLAVSHNIWLSRDQRYQLQEGTPVEVIGVGTPVWFYKGNTSEPASELFCRYIIDSRGPDLHLSHMTDGFEINIPLKHSYGDTPPPNVPGDLWATLSEEERKSFFENNPPPPNVSALKDFRDGGSEWFFFRQYHKIMRKADDNFIHLLHFVEIKDLSRLVTTLT